MNSLLEVRPGIRPLSLYSCKGAAEKDALQTPPNVRQRKIFSLDSPICFLLYARKVSGGIKKLVDVRNDISVLYISLCTASAAT